MQLFKIDAVTVAKHAIQNSAVLKKVGLLSVVRAIAIGSSVLSTAVILRLFSDTEAGKFFVLLAVAQFLAAGFLGPLGLLAVRFGSIDLANNDHNSFSRLQFFGAFIILLSVPIVYIVHELLEHLTIINLGEAWLFASVVGTTALVAFVTGLARASGRVVTAILPENVFRPLGLLAAALVLEAVELITFKELTQAYAIVLTFCCMFGAVLVPRPSFSRSIFKVRGFKPLLAAYPALMMYTFVSTALNVTDLIIVSQLISVEAAASYKVAFQYSTLIYTGVIFANIIYAPRISIAYNSSDFRLLRRLARNSSLIALVLSLVAALPLLAGPQLFELVFGSVGSEAWVLAVILSGARIFNAWFGSVTNIAYLTGQAPVLALMQAVGLAGLLVLSPLLASDFGSVGVALASALATITWTIGTALYLQWKLKTKLGPI